MKRFPLPYALLLACALLTAACGGTESRKAEEKAPEPPKPVEPVSGLKAFFQMYTAARTWAADLTPLTCISIDHKEVPAVDGKYPIWRCTFVSESRRASKVYTYSVLDAEGGIHKGIYGGNEDSYTGPKGQTSPFPMQALIKDTPEALKVAMEKGKDYVAKNPNKPVFFLLEKTKELQNPAWRVVWGESLSMSNFSIYVDASTGDYIKTMR
jgi:hypothetical protein